jgi:hypothetical protein
MSQAAGKSRIILAIGAVAIGAAAAAYFSRVDPAAAQVAPDDNPFSGPAEPGKASTVAKSPSTEFFPEPSAAEARILAALDEPTTLEFTETPLQDAIDYLKAKHKIEIQLDSRALEDVGVASDTPVTRHVSNIKLESALRLLLEDMDLAYRIEHEVLLITTQDKAEGPDGMITRTYPVGDLIETHVVERIDTTARSDTSRASRTTIICSTLSRPPRGHKRGTRSAGRGACRRSRRPKAWSSRRPAKYTWRFCSCCGRCGRPATPAAPASR